MNSGAIPASSTKRRVIIWIVVGLPLVALAVFLVARGRAGLALDDAEAALARHDPYAARASLDKLLTGSPRNDRALFLAARAARRTNSYADAEKFLTASEEISRPTEASRLEWALLGVQQGDFGDDEDRLRSSAGRNHPESAAILEALAKGYSVAQRWPDAFAALSRLLEREPNHVPGLVLRAGMSERFRRHDEAETDLRRAVEKSPDQFIGQLALAEFLGRKGHTREAIYHFELALRLREKDPAARTGLARALIDNAELDEAARHLDEVLAIEPNSATALLERGRIELRRSRPTVAEPYLARAVKAAPWSLEARQLHRASLGVLAHSQPALADPSLLNKHMEEESLGGRLKLKARDTPGDIGVRMELWEWSLRNGQVDDGVTWLTEVLKLDPKHAGAHEAFAGYFERANQPRRAALHREAAKSSGAKR